MHACLCIDDEVLKRDWEKRWKEFLTFESTLHVSWLKLSLLFHTLHGGVYPPISHVLARFNGLDSIIRILQYVLLHYTLYRSYYLAVLLRPSVEGTGSRAPSLRRSLVQ